MSLSVPYGHEHSLLSSVHFSSGVLDGALLRNAMSGAAERSSFSLLFLFVFRNLPCSLLLSKADPNFARWNFSPQAILIFSAGLPVACLRAAKYGARA
jgi:hypothetical protein